MLSTISDCVFYFLAKAFCTFSHLHNTTICASADDESKAEICLPENKRIGG
jgi:hypothetical protein